MTARGYKDGTWLILLSMNYRIHGSRYSAFLVLLHVDKEYSCFGLKTATINFVSTAS